MKMPVRILQICDKTSRGSGVFSVIFNWNRHLDRRQVQFHYLTFLPVSTEEDCSAEIAALGGQTYFVPFSARHPLKFVRDSYRFFKTHRYPAVHSHITPLNFFFFPLAKLFGTKHIIQHAHGTQWSDKKLNGWRNYGMLHAVWPLITKRLACSQAAGEVFFGKNFTVVNNGIDVEKFAYNPAVRVAKRKELGLENNFVIAHVGRFSSEKNHAFLLDVFAEVVKQDATVRLVLVGSGPLEMSIKNLARKKGLQDRVLFLGVRKDVAELYQAFDVFVLPSFHEGMPVVAPEAQAAGVPCVFSDTITPEVLLLPESCRMSLKDTPVNWAKNILTLKNAPRSSGAEALCAKGFDIRQTARYMQDLYEKLEK